MNATISRMIKRTRAVARNNSLQQKTVQLGGHVTLGAFVLALLLGLCAPKLSASVCTGLPTEAQLKTFLANAASGSGISQPLGPGTGVGGLFGGKRMWVAVVNRNGEICAYVTSTFNATQIWPGSQQIAKAKAYTANAFSLDSLALSTARLYTFVQPGHSLYGLNESNPFNTLFLAPPPAMEVVRMRSPVGLSLLAAGFLFIRSRVLS